MRTTLEIKFDQTSAIPHLQAHAHDLPGFPEITCIDFLNEGNRDLPAIMRHIMLVPNGASAPVLGPDRTPYRVPADYCAVELSIDLGIVEEKDFVVAQIVVHTSDGESIPFTHVPCELL